MTIRAALLLSLTFSLQLSVWAFSSFEGSGGNVHEQITSEALKGLISPANLKVIIDANQAQDKPGSEGVAELRRHFGDERFTSSLGYIDREKKRALNYALEADSDPEQRGRTLVHFGELLHSVQDFYSRTNYVELMLKIPAYQNDPYSIPLVDWQKVPDSYPGLLNFNVKAGNVNDSAALVKDSASSEAGKKAVAGSTQFKIARDLAVRETQRQWNLFETMIRNRSGERAAAIIAALKQASPELKVSQEQD
ncbi:MAG: hypothetical protein K2X27_10530 [Candidatus Obscuribacterales bacterium]|nr:hypothetical protein [Candidatus Obscuribacterales bacterium]